MPDVVSPEVRSRMMAGIRSKDTKPEMIVRRGLHRLGLRYRLHDKKLPGKPDLVFPRYRTAVLVHGCFWHGHDCPDFKWPKSRVDFWRDKIETNRHRDAVAKAKLAAANYRCLTIWECELKRKSVNEIAALLSDVATQIRSG